MAVPLPVPPLLAGQERVPTTFTMNPITLFAFIAGIGTTTPKPEPQPAPRPEADIQKEHGQKPDHHPGQPKCHRGGWDGN
jgi:hypothetical protein